MEKKRNGFKWNVNEVLQLQREYELLGMSIQEIAKSHNRSGKAILCKLEREGFIENWSRSRGIEEFIESDNDLCKYKSLILDGYNLNHNNNPNYNHNNCEVLSSLSSSEMESSDHEHESENLLDEENISSECMNFGLYGLSNKYKSIENFNIRNFFLFTMKIIFVLFQFIEDNFTKKMIF